MANIIDYGEVEATIKLIEDIFESINADLNERQLILKFLNERINAAVAKGRANDMMQNIPLGGLMKRFMKQNEDE